MRSLMLTVLGAYHLALGVVMVVGPRRFYDDIATYGAYNDHYIRDVATFYLALGAVMLVAAKRREWQVPVLVFAVVQYGLHVFNHIADIGDTDPGWQGPVNVISLAVVGALLWWMLRTTAQAARE